MLSAWLLNILNILKHIFRARTPRLRFKQLERLGVLGQWMTGAEQGCLSGGLWSYASPLGSAQLCSCSCSLMNRLVTVHQSFCPTCDDFRPGKTQQSTCFIAYNPSKGMTAFYTSSLYEFSCLLVHISQNNIWRQKLHKKILSQVQNPVLLNDSFQFLSLMINFATIKNALNEYSVIRGIAPSDFVTTNISASGRFQSSFRAVCSIL